MDYGKIAYLKAIETERKMRALKKKMSKTKKREITFSCSEEVQGEHNYEYKFNVLCGGKILVTVSEAGVDGSGTLKVGGVECGGEISFDSTASEYTFPITVKEGICLLNFGFTPDVQSGSFEVIIKIEGFVETLEDDYKMSSADLVNKSVVSLTGGGFSLIYEYASGVYTLKNKLTGVKELCLVGDETAFKGLVITSSDELKLIYFNSDYTVSSEIIFDSGVTSCAAYYHTDGYKYFAVKKGTVYRYSELGLRTLVGYLANKLYSDWGYNGIVIKDAHGKVKFLSFGLSDEVYKLKCGCGYHFERVLNRLTVWYSVEGKGYLQTLTGGISDGVVYSGEYDEKIKMYDGNYLLRTRGNMTVEGE